MYKKNKKKPLSRKIESRTVTIFRNPLNGYQHEQHVLKAWPGKSLKKFLKKQNFIIFIYAPDTWNCLNPPHPRNTLYNPVLLKNVITFVYRVVHFAYTMVTIYTRYSILI